MVICSLLPKVSCVGIFMFSKHLINEDTVCLKGVGKFEFLKLHKHKYIFHCYINLYLYLCINATRERIG